MDMSAVLVNLLHLISNTFAYFQREEILGEYDLVCLTKYAISHQNSLPYNRQTVAKTTKFFVRKREK